MSRHIPFLGVLMLVSLAVVTGCHPQQPIFLKHVDSELEHYKGVAQEIDYPNVDTDRSSEVSGDMRPFSLQNKDPENFWDLPLEEAVQISLANNKVMRNIGGQIQGSPDFILRNPETVPTIYDPALAESNPRTGTEAALSAFDAQLSASLIWQKIDTPQNVDVSQSYTSTDITNEDAATFQTRLSKVAATGGTFALSQSVSYALDNSPYIYEKSGYVPYYYKADWNVNLTAEARQPLLRGAGVQFNRINGPGTSQGPGNYNGVMIARINTDIALANFEAAVRNLVSDVEIAYWELYFDYRSLEAVTAGRDSALATWRKIETLYRVGGRGGELDREAQARAQYYLFQSSVETSLNALYAAESKLRYLMGLASTDGRLIRPKDEPTTAKVSFDWNDTKAEGLVRSVELRQQKWIVKRRELELIASKNFLLPQLDAVGQYRWLGLGNNLFETSGGTGSDFTSEGSDAYHSLTSGQFQDWQAGFQLSMPLGYRKEHAGVRNAQLNVAKERAKLTEGELELTNQIAGAIRDLETTYVLTQTNWNRRIATQRQVEAVEQAYLTDTVAIDVLLKAQQERAQAESDYFRTLVNYNKSISMVHFRKGSLLEYNGVYLAEGPWPGKAYFDARRRARARGASTHFDYGFTQPRVISRGPYEQHAGAGRNQIFDNSEIENAAPTPAPQSEQELVPTPSPDVSQPTAAPNMPLPPEPQASTSEAVRSGTKSGAAKSASRSTTDKVGQASAARQTSGDSSSKVGRTNQNEPEVTSVGSNVDAASNYESGTYPSTAATHQPASGWTSVQH